MMNKEQLLILYADILNAGEAEINAHLDDESHMGVVALSQRVGKQMDCDPMLAYQVIKSYVEGREDIETVKGRNGGIRRIQAQEKKVDVLTPLGAAPSIADILSAPIPSPMIVEKAEEQEPQEVAAEDILTIIPEVFDENTPLPNWATAKIDPRAKRAS